MSASVFEKLLGSYSGMRKRTWEPALIEEALDDEQTKQYNTVYTAVQQALNQLAPGNEQAGFGDRKNITITKDPTGQGFTISGSNLGRKKFRNFAKEFSSRAASTETSKIRAVMSAWSPKEGSEKKGDEKSKETPADVGTPQEPQGFEKTQRDDIARYIEQKAGVDPSQAQTFVQKIQDTILTPFRTTKLGKLFDKRPDAANKIKEQLLDLTSRFFSMASKVETVTLADGSQVKVIRSELLSAGDRKAARIITVRGVDGSKGVRFGRVDGEFIEEYKELQEYARAYDHKTYGATLGSAMDRYGKAMFDTRILPEGVDPSTMTKEDFEKLELAAQKSTAAGTGSGQNDTKGKLAEDMIQLGAALVTGDKSQIKEAQEQLKTRLEKIGSVGDIDTEHLESFLLDGEYDDLESLIAGAEGLQAELRRTLEGHARKFRKLLDRVGIGAIEQSLRPSQESGLGERTDNQLIINDSNPLNKGYEDLMNSNGDGTYSVEISVKEYDSPTSETVLGSSTPWNAYSNGKDREKFDKLHDEQIQRMVDNGNLSQEQSESCQNALEADREALQSLESTLGSLTRPNKAALKSQIRSLIKNAGNQGFTSIAAQESYVKELKTLQESIDNGNPKDAATKLFQLGRIVRAENDPQYAAGAFVNDSILSMGSFKNEMLMRGSPTEVSFGSTHDMLGRVAQDCFSGQMSISVGLTGASLKDAQGRVLMRNNVRARASKQTCEGRMTAEGKDRYMETETI